MAVGKPALEINAQIALLASRGLPVPEHDRVALARLLPDSSYARIQIPQRV